MIYMFTEEGIYGKNTVYIQAYVQQPAWNYLCVTLRLAPIIYTMF